MKKVIISFFSLLFFSCGLGFINRKGFTVYKNPITGIQSTKIKTDGVFVSIDQQRGIRGFYLYRNGLYHYEYFKNNFWDSPQKELNCRKFFYVKSDDYGQYQILNDTIHIQDFYSNNNNFFRKNLINYKGLILNDSIIKIFSWYTKDNDNFLDEPITYKFYKLSEKPDSTQAWFLNNKWYQKNVHESRK